MDDGTGDLRIYRGSNVSDDKTTTVKDIVANHLRKHPDYLVRNPELLEFLELRHESGPAVSLIERQVDQLRQKNEELSRQLKQLIQVASENERLMSRLHALTLELMSVEDLGAFFDRLTESLREEFKADILNISLFDRKVEASAGTPLYRVRSDDPDLGQFQPHFEKGHTVCGRLNRSKLDFLFGARGQWVQSTALVPLGSHGLMAIGSSDPARFYPGMGTLFMDLLAKVVENRLERQEPERERRTA